MKHTQSKPDWLRRAQASAAETAQRLREDAAKNERAFNSEHRLRAENLAWDIDVWYRRLAPYTFETVFLPLSLAEASAITHNYDVSWRGKPTSFLTTDDVLVLRHLEARIDSALAQPPFRSSSQTKPLAFMRLCGRSPKDGEPLDRKAVWSRYQTNLATVEQELSATTSDHHLKVLGDVGNRKLIAASRTPTLCVDSGAAAMSLLCSSERAFLDMVDWLKHGEPEQIVLRRWEPRIRLDYEFRVFVSEGNITAISQYDHYCVFPNLPSQKAEIQEAISVAWSEFHDAVGVQSYCVDVIYLPDEKRAMLLELSPLLPCTGPACFSWTKDAALLRGEMLADQGIIFRLNEHIRPQIEDLVECQWEDRWLRTDIQPYDHHWQDAQPKQEQQSKFRVIAAGVSVCVALAAATTAAISWVAFAFVIMLCFFGYMSMNFFSRQQEGEVLFVYGTLQKGFHWHDKFLCSAEFLGRAKSVRTLPLTVGDCGVPYVLGDVEGGKAIRGECWSVDPASLKGMDSYEGCSKGYYQRRKEKFEVAKEDGTSEQIEAWIYVKTSSSSSLSQEPFLEEYNKELHDRVYMPIKHILVKQQAYLDYSASTWGQADASPAFDEAKS